MGSSPSCMSTPQTPLFEGKRSLGENRSLTEASGNSFWIGEWSYFVSNEVHHFHIKNKRGQLVYEEILGSRKMTGKVIVTSEICCVIKCKKMNFEIELNKESLTARYRQKGSRKWTKPIQLLKFEEANLTLSGAGTVSRNKSTLRNTLKNRLSMPCDNSNNDDCLLKQKSERSLRWFDEVKAEII